MKVLSTEGLTKLIQLIKSSFISVNDTIEAQTIDTVEAGTMDTVEADTMDTVEADTMDTVEAGTMDTVEADTMDAREVDTVELATVATSGSYNDLTDKPTIGDAEIEIQKNSTKVDSFTVNQTGEKQVINITVPTVPSDIGAATSDHTHSIYVLKAGDTMTGTLVINKNTDASGTSNNSPALIVGGTATAAHLELDNNELMAKASGTTTADLYLNSDGGLVHVGSGGLDVNGSIGMNSGAAKMQYNSTTQAIEFVFT